jgi:hypothetical protein
MKHRTSFRAAMLALAILLVGSLSVLAEGTCADCHNDTTVITGKQFAVTGTLHATGTSAAYAGGRGACTACHSGASFSGAVAAGQAVQDFTTVVDITRQDCRACHQIHVTGTAADWALETVAPLTLYASGVEYDGGKGNLCANCHQPRREIAAPDDDGNIRVTSTHWGPHHGPQSAVLLGVGGASAEGEASLHGSFVSDTCVSCHLGDGMNHTFAPDAAACLTCHDPFEDPDGNRSDFDFGFVQTDVKAKLAELADLLVAKGLLSEEKEWEIGEDGVNVQVVHGYHPVVGTYPAAEAAALWDFILLSIEDGSLGTHNPGYTKALLDAAIAAVQ